VTGDSGDDLMIGGPGHDFFFADSTAFTDTASGRAGNDVAEDGTMITGRAIVAWTTDDDVITGRLVRSREQVDENIPRNQIIALGTIDLVVPESGAHPIRTTEGADEIVSAEPGDDVVPGRSDDDVVAFRPVDRAGPDDRRRLAEALRGPGRAGHPRKGKDKHRAYSRCKRSSHVVPPAPPLLPHLRRMEESARPSRNRRCGASHDDQRGRPAACRSMGGTGRYGRPPRLGGPWGIGLVWASRDGRQVTRCNGWGKP